VPCVQSCWPIEPTSSLTWPAFCIWRRHLPCVCRDGLTGIHPSWLIRICSPHYPGVARVARARIRPRGRGLLLPNDLLRHPVPSAALTFCPNAHVPPWRLNTPSAPNQAPGSVRGPVHGPIPVPSQRSRLPRFSGEAQRRAASARASSLARSTSALSRAI
jgi:hypothetical protein